MDTINAQKGESVFRHTDLREIVTRSTEEAPRSALYEYVRSMRSDNALSGHASVASEESLDSDISRSTTHASAVDGFSDMEDTQIEAETRDLIYRLCRSLLKKAVQRTKGQQHSSRQARVVVDERHEKNMSVKGDWMPLLHLFDPQAFFAERGMPVPLPDGQLPTVISERPFLMNVASNAREASQLLLDELEVEKMSGGNSNHVYRLAHPNFPNKVILLRVYGAGDSEAIDRVRDVMAMRAMSEAQLSPAVLHSFRWGRVEEFMDDVATCSTDMLLCSPTLLSEVWALAFEMHQLPYCAFLPENVNNAKIRHMLPPSPLEQRYATPEEYCEVVSEELTKAVQAKKIDSYFFDDTNKKLMEDLCPSSFERTCMRFLRLTSRLIKEPHRAAFSRFVSGEVMQLRQLLQQRGVPLVFSHNDLNPGNILLAWRKVPSEMRSPAVVLTTDDEDDEVTAVSSDLSNAFSRMFLTKRGQHRNLVDMRGILFIDFEYSDVNYRCFDLGNSICELDYDYTRGNGEGEPGFIKYLFTFPPTGYAERWAELPMTYPRAPELLYSTWQENRGAANQSDAAAAAAGGSPHLGDICLSALRAYVGRGEATRDAAAPIEVPLELLTEVFLGMLCSHLSWSLWSLVMCANTDECTNNADEDSLFARGSSGLDYIYYGNCRMQEYLSLKEWMQEKKLI